MSIDLGRLRPVILAYTERALRELGAACEEGPESVLVGLRDWERSDETSFVLRDRTIPWWQSCVEASRARRHAWTEYTELVEVIRDDPLLSTQVDTLVGTQLGATRQDVEHVADALIWALSRRTQSFAFDRAIFEEELSSLVEEQESQELGSVLIGPLVGVKGTGFPIALGAGFEIRQLDDSEIVWCLRMGLLRSLAGMNDLAHVGDVIGIRIRLSFPKVVGGVVLAEADNQALSVRLQKAAEDGQAVVEAMRAYKKGRFGFGGLLRYEVRRGGGGWGSGAGSATTNAHWVGDYELDDQECAGFAEFWERFAKAKRHKLVDGAIRRLSYGADRVRADDRLVDFVIAAETLFLGDAANPEVRGEMRYRYALNAAHFVDVPGVSRVQVFKFMRNSYDARSAIVHGGEPSKKSLIGLYGDKLTLGEYADAVEDVLRLALRRVIAELPHGAGPLADWESLVLGHGG